MPARVARPRREAGTQGVQSVEIAARILGCFSVNEAALGVTQISERLHMSKSKVHRFLVSLQRVGLIRRDPFTDRYSLGLKLYELGQTAVAGLDVLTNAGQVARRLAHETGLTASVAVWTDTGPVLSIVTATPPGQIGIGYAVGSVLSLHASAHGKIFLSFLPSEEETIFGTLRQFTSYTLTDPLVLQAQRDRIRHERLAASRNESALGLFEISSPVFGIAGDLVASLGIVALNDQVTPERARGLGEAVREAAADLSLQLGYDSSVDGAGCGPVTPESEPRRLAKATPRRSTQHRRPIVEQ